MKRVYLAAENFSFSSHAAEKKTVYKQELNAMLSQNF